MRNFIEVIIIGIIIYWVVKLTYRFLKVNVYGKLMGPKGKRKRTAKENAILKKIYMKHANTIKAEEFAINERHLKAGGFETPGAYIFTNLYNGKTYVGQSVNILNRVRTHLNGRGNKLIYDDLKLDKFTIQFIKLSSTDYKNLDDLERHYIYEMNSYLEGYNKTKGNGG